MIRITSDLPDQAGLVIIGGGIVGAASAFFAAQAGLDPLILENRSALATLTTPASTGAFRLQFDNQAELEMIRESVDMFLNFAEFTDQKEYRAGIIQQGYLWVTTRRARAEYQRALVARQHSWGQTDIEMLDGDEVRNRFPTSARPLSRVASGQGTDSSTPSPSRSASPMVPTVRWSLTPEPTRSWSPTIESSV